MTSQDHVDQMPEATGLHADDAGRPTTEPGPAILRDDAPSPGPQAPGDPAPDMDEINAGEGPGVTPGE